MYLAINDQLLYLIAAAAYGVFAWWTNRRKGGGELDQGEGEGIPRNEAPPPRNDAPPPRSDTPVQPSTPAPAPRQSQQADSEQERLRRFLEALGVPAGAQQPPKPAQPQQRPPLAPEPPRQRPPVQIQRPQPPRPAPQPPRQIFRPQVQPVRPPPRPIPVFLEPESAESRDPGRLEESATAIEGIGAELDHMSQDVRTMSATSQAPAASPGAAGALFTATQARTMIEIFRSPETLRTALLAQEILGPPRGLQS